MNNQDRIELLRAMHTAINEQLCEAIDSGADSDMLENMPLYTIGIGGKVFSFPATIIYRVMFDCLFAGYDELKDDKLAGIDGTPDQLDVMDDLADAMNDMDW